MLACGLLLLFLILASAAQTPLLHASVVTSDPIAVNGQTFDYIIVGGGLSGLTVAGRLTEDPSTRVLVVEAGNDDRTNPNISDIFNYGAVFQTALDWHWETDMGRIIRGGRTLGGSSSINDALWSRDMKQYYDSISQLLTEEDAALNWSFDSLFSYMKKAETFHPPNEAQRAKGANFVPEYHGFSGPVQTAFTPFMFGGPQQPAFISSVRNVTRIEQCPDVAGGFSNCVAYAPQMMNPSADYNRSSSATAYLSPVEFERPNWVTLVGHQVTKVLLDGEAPNVTATGVQFKKSDNTGDDFTANARLEVIVSSGNIGTPQVLQVSGIGDPEVLEPLGIPVKVILRTVGRNFQEKVEDVLVHPLQPSFNPDGRGPPNVYAFPSLRQIFSEHAGSNGSVTFDEIADYIMAMIPSWAESQAVNGLNAEALTTIFGVQGGLIINDNVPAAEMLFNTTAPSGLNIVTWLQHPFSRGNVTITSPSIFTPPQVNVNYFSVDFDLALQTAVVRAARKVLNDPAFNGISTSEVSPGLDVVPDDGHGDSDAAWQAWIHEDFAPVFHSVGSSSMMRRDLGGVVDGKLRVYDTVNLRVVDAGILPIELAAHLSSTLYGVAEKAADIIKSGI